MSNIREAADEAKKLVKMLNSVRIVADALDGISSVENYLAEVNGRLAQAQELEAAEIKKREAVVASSNAIVANAEAEANRLIAEAKSFAAQAHEEARMVRDSINAAKSNAAKAATKVQVEVDGKKAELSAINELIHVRNVELAAVNSNITEAKATIEKMLRG